MHILKKNQSELRTILDDANPNKPLFDKYTKKIDNYAFKGEYAKAHYKEILGDRNNMKDYRGYDSEVIKILTVELGHNRTDVALYNYMK